MDLYLIALIPDSPLREEVKEIKEEMKTEYGASHALKSPAHITLQMPFKRNPDEEDYLSSALREFAANEKPFNLDLDGFGAFPPRVIYIRITDPKPVKELHERLKKVLTNTLGFTRKEIMQHMQPHITVATRDLTRVAFKEAWPEMKDREFTGRFTVKSVFLLRHNGRHWDILLEYPFDER